jgi:hypothetical protein
VIARANFSALIRWIFTDQKRRVAMDNCIDEDLCQKEWLKQLLFLESQLPDLLEPDTPKANYRSFGRRLYHFTCQQCLLELDELIEQYNTCLSIATPLIHIGEGGPCCDEKDTKFDAHLDPDQIDKALKPLSQCVDEIVGILQRYDTPENAGFIERLVFAFENKKWVPSTLLEACRSLDIQRGPKDDIDAWLGRHRSHRQATRLNKTTCDVIAPAARQRL